MRPITNQSAYSDWDLKTQDAYFSIDVETDGPIPGDFSMLSFAIVEAGHHDGSRFWSADEGDGRYWELMPISAKFDAEALRVNGLDRGRLSAEGLIPTLAMTQASEWVVEHSRGRRPVMVASPASFDWMFMHWYFIKYAGSSPFGHSSCFDVKTAVAVKLDRPIARSGRKSIPEWMMADIPHSHHALDDAREQARIFGNVLGWRGHAPVVAL
jgi:hypothetical protein